MPIIIDAQSIVGRIETITQQMLDGDYKNYGLWYEYVKNRETLITEEGCDQIKIIINTACQQARNRIATCGTAPQALTFLGLTYSLGGFHGEPDHAEAIRLYEQAIALGDAAANFNRANMHQQGLGGEINYPEAIRLYEQAIALGQASAMVNRALMHEGGLGGEVNYPEAIRLYEQAIRLENNRAIQFCSNLYRTLYGESKRACIQALLPLIWGDLLKEKLFLALP